MRDKTRAFHSDFLYGSGATRPATSAAGPGMDIAALILDLRVPLVVLLAFAIAANDAAAGMATAFGAGTLPLRVALVAGAGAAVVPVLLLTVPVGLDVLDPLLPPGGGPAVVRTVGLAAAATALVMLVATVPGLPVPAIAVMAGALAGLTYMGADTGAAAEAGAAGDAGAALPVAALAWIAAPAVLLPAVAALLAGPGFAGLRRRVLGHARPRDRLRGTLPWMVGLSLAAGAWLCVATFAHGPGPAVWAGAPAAALVAGAAGFAAVRTAVVRRPFWAGNDAEGADRAHHRLQVGGSLVLAFLVGGYQAVAVAAPVGLMLLEPARGTGAEVGAAAWLAVALPVALGVYAGILALGQRTVRRVGTGLAPLSPARGAVANLAALAALAGGGTAGMPLYGAQAAAGAVAGVGAGDGALRGRGTLTAMVLAWIAAAPLGAGVALGLDALARALSP
jgi:phosphate/sulfate permease